MRARANLRGAATSNEVAVFSASLTAAQSWPAAAPPVAGSIPAVLSSTTPARRWPASMSRCGLPDLPSADQYQRQPAKASMKAPSPAPTFASIATDRMPPGEYAANAFEIVSNGGLQLIASASSPMTPPPFPAMPTRSATSPAASSKMSDESFGLWQCQHLCYLNNAAIGDLTDSSAAVVTPSPTPKPVAF